MTYTNFPSGITSFGVPVVGSGSLPIGPSYYFVNSVTGSDGNEGTFESPLATLDYAIGKCAANKGDVIVLEAGHAEAVASASAITADVAGISIIGLGNGTDRPEFTFGTAVTASLVVSADNITIRNIVGIAGINALTKPFDIQAMGCTLDIEWQDGTSAIEANRAILGNASADRLNVTLKYIGFPAGSSCVNAVRLVGSNNAIINTDFYGKASTSWVEFLTTACTNVEVSGYMYNSGTTDGSKNVIDTVTGSTWYAVITDGAAGSSFSGGSGAALATDDVSVVAANQAVGTANATTNTLERDVTGNKTDTSVYVPGTTKSLAAYVKGTADLQVRVAKKTAAVMSNGLVLFTIAGGPIQIEELVSVCESTNDGTASTLQYSVTPTSGSATTISGASASLAAAAAGASVALAGTALSTAALLSATGPNLIANPSTVFAPIGTITAVVAVGSTTGTWAHYIRYRPLAASVTVS